jgi:hypothetical protein
MDKVSAQSVSRKGEEIGNAAQKSGAQMTGELGAVVCEIHTPLAS